MRGAIRGLATKRWPKLVKHERDGGVHTVIHGLVVEPAAGDGFGLGVELHNLLAVWA